MPPVATVLIATLFNFDYSLLLCYLLTSCHERISTRTNRTCRLDQILLACPKIAMIIFGLFRCRSGDDHIIGSRGMMILPLHFWLPWLGLLGIPMSLLLVSPCNLYLILSRCRLGPEIILYCASGLAIIRLENSLIKLWQFELTHYGSLPSLICEL